MRQRDEVRIGRGLPSGLECVLLAMKVLSSLNWSVLLQVTIAIIPSLFFFFRMQSGVSNHFCFVFLLFYVPLQNISLKWRHATIVGERRTILGICSEPVTCIVVEQSMILINIVRQLRVCILCDHNDIEDEFHFILKCPFYSDIRKMYIKKYYYQKPSMFKLVNLLSTQIVKELCNLGKVLIKATLACNSVMNYLFICISLLTCNRKLSVLS